MGFIEGLIRKPSTRDILCATRRGFDAVQAEMHNRLTGEDGLLTTSEIAIINLMAEDIRTYHEQHD